MPVNKWKINMKIGIFNHSYICSNFRSKTMKYFVYDLVQNNEITNNERPSQSNILKQGFKAQYITMNQKYVLYFFKKKILPTFVSSHS